MSNEEGRKIYKCFKCGKLMTMEEYKELYRCPSCRSNSVFKTRPKVVRTIKAR